MIKVRYLLFLLPFLLLWACKPKADTSAQSVPQVDSTDIKGIKLRGELVVLTINDPTSYFNYRDEEMGYQYDLAKDFAQHLGVQLKISVAKDEQDLITKLLKGEGDLIAYGLTITNESKEKLIYCGEEHINYQVIVQRKGKKAVKEVTELIGKEVYAYDGKYMDRLLNLNKELGSGIIIKSLYIDSISMDKAIGEVAEGKIDYLLCDKVWAMVNRTYYGNLNTDLEITFGQRASWATSKRYPLLAQAVNEWSTTQESSSTVKASIQKYFTQQRIMGGDIALGTTPRPARVAVKLTNGAISVYDDLFKKYAPEVGWHWTTLASLAYTESNFNPDVKSWSGAVGLMQLMPRTARALGVPAGMETDPEESIKAAVKYIKRLQRLFKNIESPEEREKFVLASYNSGEGHVLDAMALAQKYGKNKYVWNDNVAEFILLKSQEEYYQDPVCKNGYFRGRETYNFVSKVLGRAASYKAKVGE